MLVLGSVFYIINRRTLQLKAASSVNILCLEFGFVYILFAHTGR